MTEIDPRTIFPSGGIPTETKEARLLGLYPQIQDGLWMHRVKVPGGVLDAGRWRALAAIASEFTPTTPLHLTTRQDIELHDLRESQIGQVQQRLFGAGLTSLGSGGDGLRNVTICPCSGAIGGRPDLLGLAQTLQATLEAQEGAFALPRKFKISLSCSDSCGQPWINDLGLVAKTIGGQWGFSVVIAGSLGANPATGISFADFVPAGDVLPLALAALRVFASHGDRQNRNKARLRHVRQRLGDQPFVELMQREFQSAKSHQDWPAMQSRAPLAALDAWTTLTFANGDVEPAQARALGDLAARQDVRVRIENWHRVIVYGQSPEALDALVAASPALRQAAQAGPNVVACPGTRWCKHGLTDTNALANRIRQDLAGHLPPQVLVGVSGCPNGCAHSRVADIGLTGAVVTVDGQKIEAWNLFTGGGRGQGPTLASQQGVKLAGDDVLQRLRAD
jgi:sulfite reductase (ferredoxin)